MKKLLTLSLMALGLMATESLQGQYFHGHRIYGGPKHQLVRWHSIGQRTIDGTRYNCIKNQHGNMRCQPVSKRINVAPKRCVNIGGHRLCTVK